MRRLDSRVLLVCIALVLLGLGAWSLRYFGRYRPFADLMQDYTKNGPGRIGLQIRDAVVVGRADGHLRWRLAARSIQFSQDRRQVQVIGIHDGALLDSQERPVLAVSAGRAVYDAPAGALNSANTQGDVHLEGGIRATMLLPPGAVITAQALSWQADRNLAQSLGPVTVTFPRHAGVAIGDHVEVDTKSGDLTLSHLHGTFAVPPGVE